MISHEHKWKYKLIPSKSGKNLLVERKCACGIMQLSVIEASSWSRERKMKV